MYMQKHISLHFHLQQGKEFYIGSVLKFEVELTWSDMKLVFV